VVYVELDGHTEDGYTIYEDGSEELTAPGTAVAILMEIHFKDDRWIVDAVDFEEI
jgi:hypothetical protein